MSNLNNSTNEKPLNFQSLLCDSVLARIRVRGGQTKENIPDGRAGEKYEGNG